MDSPVPPPPRRRPVPSTPAYRPKVAGLNKQRQAEPAAPDAAPQVEAPETAAPPVDEPTAVESVDVPDRVSLAKTAAPDTDDVPTAAVDAVDLGDTDTEPAEAEVEPAPAPAKPVGRRRTSTRVPSPTPRTADDEAADAESDAADAADTADQAGKTRSPLLLPLVLLLVAAALAGLGYWFQTRDRGTSVNQALVDTGGTTEVSGQAREAVEKAFSYNFADVAATESAANELLVGKAKCQYNAIFGPVKSLAPEQKLVVTVRVVSSGVTSLDGDRATVLLFIDQVTTRTTDNTTGGGIAMMRVGTQRADGRWKVDNMEMFGQTGDQSAEMAKCADAK
ncbi:hypothetical protein [Umezawaea sp. NPDC059074]|uniref:hypothetical protein n=1 Tax=Umezawaea sp. NPDC059074 TaxID=3346716 RepID=UPI0036A7D1D2